MATSWDRGSWQHPYTIRKYEKTADSTGNDFTNGHEEPSGPIFDPSLLQCRSEMLKREASPALLELYN
ncbi:uncharacterized protein N7469_005804 [Penicillium citrinum]|uniref:Uncharacterized protein n=2 Tax=Penicillium TaxID=5073 RepID=A0A9W9TQ03_PENCI|nr:uncharacterized protein N7469_005804 [Penicillium citrinum]KAJ5234038.1 hypothetical protein N7469_005804 [Penicillium citrinum]KAJ5572480.1 hypothetical protein N7450_009464 [Penicillium hetheringtonii]